MQELSDIHEFVTTFAGDDRYISDYLIAEVIEHQPRRVQEFLLRTAVVDRFCGSLCDALMEGLNWESESVEQVNRRPNQAIVERLDQSNLFIIPLDNKREWYRYHHLLVDFLRMRLRDRSTDAIAERHRRAAVWLENNGLLAEAIDHSLAGEDF